MLAQTRGASSAQTSVKTRLLGLTAGPAPSSAPCSSVYHQQIQLRAKYTEEAHPVCPEHAGDQAPDRSASRCRHTASTTPSGAEIQVVGATSGWGGAGRGQQ